MNQPTTWPLSGNSPSPAPRSTLQPYIPQAPSHPGSASLAFRTADSSSRGTSGGGWTHRPRHGRIVDQARTVGSYWRRSVVWANTLRRRSAGSRCGASPVSGYIPGIGGASGGGIRGMIQWCSGNDRCSRAIDSVVGENREKGLIGPFLVSRADE